MTLRIFAALCAILVSGSFAHAAVVINSSSEPTPNLPGFITWTLTATSNVQGENIVAMDWAGDPPHNDPATGRGFFGPMNQLSLLGGALPTVFSDFNLFIPAFHPGHTALEDSQFLVNSAQLIVPSGYAEESPNHLQALWSWPTSPGLSVPFTQLTIPSAASEIDYRGVIFVERGSSIVGESVSGTFGVPNMPPMAHDAEVSIRAYGAIARHQFTATDDQSGLTWDNLTLVSPRLPANAPILDADGRFSWNTIDSMLRGPFDPPYVFEVTVTDPGGLTDTARLTVRWIPEPSSCTLLGLSGGALCLVRRRTA